MNTIRILLVDDHEPFRRLLADFLKSHDSVEIVGEAVNGQEAIRKADELLPDLVLMDLTMPGLSGFDATRAIKQKYPGTKVVVLSSHSGEVYRTEALSCRADDYIEKNSMKNALNRILDQEVTRGLRAAM